MHCDTRLDVIAHWDYYIDSGCTYYFRLGTENAGYSLLGSSLRSAALCLIALHREY